MTEGEYRSFWRSWRPCGFAQGRLGRETKAGVQEHLKDGSRLGKRCTNKANWPGVIASNEPNFRVAGRAGGASTSPETPCGVTMNRAIVRNKPNLLRGRVPGVRVQQPDTRAFVPNKPNFGLGKTKDKCCVDKELQRMGCGSSRGKTKPKGGSRLKKRWYQTNPISARRTRQTGPRLCRKRLAASLRTGLLRQTNPICGSAIGG